MAMLRRPSVRRGPSTISKISSETARPIKAKLHVEHPWGRGTKVYINGPGDINCKKKKLKIFFTRTRRPMILKLGMTHWGEELFKVYINCDPGMQA